MSYLSRVFRATEEANRRAILGLLPKGVGGSLLDLGTSRGGFTLRVAARMRATRVAGVELIEAHAAHARSLGMEVVAADLDDGIPFEGRFDVVHANQVIEHVRRTDLLLREIRRVLAPRGIACISTNNLSSWHNVLSLALGLQPMPIHVSDEVIVGNPLNPEHRWGHRDAGRTHLRLFTARALVELASHHGLVLDRLETVGYYPLPPRAGGVAARLDRAHGAFVVAAFRRGAVVDRRVHIPASNGARAGGDVLVSPSA